MEDGTLALNGAVDELVRVSFARDEQEEGRAGRAPPAFAKAPGEGRETGSRKDRRCVAPGPPRPAAGVAGRVPESRRAR